MQYLLKIGRATALVAFVGLTLASCGSSGDGAEMSDAQKIERANQGRESQMQGQKPGK